MPKVHTLNVILQCTTLDRFCNAMQFNATCYIFTEHGKELVSVCNACVNVILQCTTLDRFCNAMQCNATCVISLMNMGRSSGVQCNTMHAFSLNVILQCTPLIVETNDRFVQCNATTDVIAEHGKELVLVCNAGIEVHTFFFNDTQRQIVCAMQQYMLSL